MRDELEKQVLAMSLQRDALDTEMGAMVHTEQTVQALVQEVRVRQRAEGNIPLMELQ